MKADTAQIRLILLIFARVLASCSAPEPAAPATLGDANCDFEPFDMKAAQQLSQLPRTNCQSNADCVLIPGVCGGPDAAHQDDAACVIKITESNGAVVDCAPYEETRTSVARCIESKCVATFADDAAH